MVKNKYIILPFLFLAWTIIFAHSVVPHHHHDISVKHANCSHSGEYESVVINEVHECEHDCDGNACSFSVDVLTDFSVDKIFTTNSSEIVYRHFFFESKLQRTYSLNLLFDQYCKTIQHRGPPVIV